ncbi:hypothetical protein CTZ29_07905 [Bacillus halotolerans]|nr:hypothetical protein CTZ29_07905 [Bacillus halotolerans]
MIYAACHDFRRAQNRHKDKCIFFQSRKISAFVLVCFICLFLSNLPNLFPFFRKSEKERKSRTN